jgi:hypothetical protein
MDWGIGWQSDLAPHKHSTSVHLVMGSELLESYEHYDSQQQGSRNCWGIESLDTAGWNILVQLPATSAKTAAEQDGTQVRLKAQRYIAWSYCLAYANAPTYTCVPSHLCGSLA